MPTYEQAKYCPNCKKNVSADKEDRCKICGGKIERGGWSVRFRILEYSGTRQKRLSGYETKKKAEQAYIDFMKDHQPYTEQKTNKINFNEAINSYYAYCESDNDESTLYEKKQIVNNFILPHFQNIEIENISKVMLMDWQVNLWSLTSGQTKQKYSWKYLSKIRGVFYNFLSYCEYIYDIPNKFRYIKKPKNKESKKEIEFWELDTFDRFIKNYSDTFWNTLWHTFMFTGARLNEIRALSDDDIKENVIIINKALVGKKAKKEKGTTKPTKNYKVVKKQIPKILQNKIEEYKKWKSKEKISSRFLFGGDYPLSETTLRRNLTEGIKKAEINKIITPHGFRHSYVSLLINLGVSTKIIAELIGDREEQVIKTYGHLYKGVKDSAIDLMNAKINNTI